MITLQDVNNFLEQFKVKARIFGLIFRTDREKNTRTFLDLHIDAQKREEIIFSLEGIDYSHNPIGDTLAEGNELWVFGKDYYGVELYIKITLLNGGTALCISFHEAEHPLNYPFKTKEE